jgi:alanine racemase
MDMIVADVTEVPAHLRTPEQRITLIGKEQPIDKVAEAAGTIGYEIFTRLGRRVHRIYR